MPVIMAFPDVTRAYVRVEVDWADVPSVEYAQVIRVDVETGECVPLRPYVCFFGDYLRLSCGRALFWDTEAPLDRSIYYITEGLGAPCEAPADPCETCTPITADTSDDPITVASNGAFRLRNPTYPCRDIYVPLCFDQVSSPECLPGSGTFFASMDTETYDANSINLLPTNAEFPIAVSRKRRGVASVLQLVTRTFPDRDAVLYANKPGVPLQWAGPPQYGIPALYMSVGDIDADRGLTDHKFPVRIMGLPFLQVGRPAGPSNGVCGSRVEDMCDIYSTWDEIEAAGLDWEDLLRGLASNDSGPGPGLGRTWDEVQAEFADWNAVDTGGRTWTDLAAGD